MSQITPVLLCGGSGTRLWPLSRKSYPKQFVPLLSDETLYQATAKRLTGANGTHAFAPPIVVTNSDFRFIVTEQLQETGIDPGAVLIEPAARNTAPAILAAVLHAHANDPEAILLVSPTDQVVPDPAAFRKAVAAGLPATDQGQLVTFGITPDRAETGYGYLELHARPDGDTPVPLKSFTEKPDAATAQEMLEGGCHLWNAGIFLFRAADMIAAFEAHAPGLLGPVRRAVDGAQPDLGFLRLDPTAFAEAEDISIDYAVMEKSANLSVVPYSGGWSDLGSWEAVWQEMPRDEAGVAADGPVTAIDCRDTLLRSEADSLELVGLGLDNVMAVAMPDAVLIADRSRAQDVKAVVDTLKTKNRSQATHLPRDYRPWGWFESLVVGDRFQVKRIVVRPGGILSLQSHVHRAEHWIVVEGTARVTIGEEVRLVTENQSVFIPLGEVHRMENPGKVPMVLIEVQTGSYLGEDDITRYEDLYARG
ncbi:mannose-1-phosphate guanylyltransferase/mannose-6-phosphate isomerase [Aestuariibius sp. 2305UL40-4]|uniref:mannose-1-phosphate guanylyltransferase/mannose-6-phosphate isomerase n=1 Tax=Aestuariibius violaceus TaxID=3234132 RepID=UPI00345E4EC2